MKFGTQRLKTYYKQNERKVIQYCSYNCDEVIIRLSICAKLTKKQKNRGISKIIILIFEKNKF